MAAFGTYSELIATINDWLDRSDLSGSAESMIALTDAKMRRIFTPLFNEVSATVSVVSGLGVLPADYGLAVRVIYDGVALPQVGDYIGTMAAAASEPVAYSFEQGKLRLWPSCTVTVSLLYQPALPALTSAAPTNSLLTLHPDLYFFGSMLFANGYLANDSRAANFKVLWEEALAEAKVYFTRQKFSGPLVPVVADVP